MSQVVSNIESGIFIALAVGGGFLVYEIWQEAKQLISNVVDLPGEAINALNDNIQQKIVDQAKTNMAEGKPPVTMSGTATAITQAVPIFQTVPGAEYVGTVMGYFDETPRPERNTLDGGLTVLSGLVSQQKYQPVNNNTQAIGGISNDNPLLIIANTLLGGGGTKIPGAQAF